MEYMYPTHFNNEDGNPSAPFQSTTQPTNFQFGEKPKTKQP